MALPTYKELLDSGVHFGHLKKKWNPKMRPYIFMEKRGIHIIDLHKTSSELEKAGAAARSIARSGKKILFVATKKQGRDIIRSAAESVNMPFVTERWLGGMLTNLSTIRRSVKKMKSIERMLEDGSFNNVTKKERLMLTRDKEKMERVLGGIANLNRQPSAMFIIDPSFEHIALKEAAKLGIRTLGMVDTNCDPSKIDFPIPANDDASKSINIITQYITDCVKEGLSERAQEKEDKKAEVEAAKQAEAAKAAAIAETAADAGETK